MRHNHREPLRPQTVLVTGATSGIGHAITSALLSDGHTVVGIGRDLSKLSFDTPFFHGYAIDLEEVHTLPERLKTIQTHHPEISTVICNAGRGLIGSIEECSYTQIQSLITLNFTSQALFIRTLLPQMKKQGRGNLIFMGSEAALQGKKQGALYCATKFAVRGFSQALREECASAGIQVTLINPGMVNTPFFDTLRITPGESHDNAIDPEDIAILITTILNTRQGTNIDEINLTPMKRCVKMKK